MNITDRLKGTSLENDPRAWFICKGIEFCNDRGCLPPSEREWCKIFGCLPKGRPRRGQEQKGFYPENQIRKIFSALGDEGIIKVVSGRGRGGNSYMIIGEGSLLAAKRADYEKRKAVWADEVKMKLKDDVEVKKAAIWADVDDFIEFWSEHDADYNMRWENELKESGRKYFSIKTRWSRWNGKHAVKQTTAPCSPPVKGKPLQIVMKENDKIFNEWLKTKGISADEYDFLTMHEELEEYMENHRSQ